MGAVPGPFFSHVDNFFALSGPGVVQDPKSRRSAVTVTAAAGINDQLFRCAKLPAFDDRGLDQFYLTLHCNCTVRAVTG